MTAVYIFNIVCVFSVLGDVRQSIAVKRERQLHRRRRRRRDPLTVRQKKDPVPVRQLHHSERDGHRHRPPGYTHRQTVT